MPALGPRWPRRRRTAASVVKRPARAQRVLRMSRRIDRSPSRAAPADAVQLSVERGRHAPTSVVHPASAANPSALSPDLQIGSNACTPSQMHAESHDNSQDDVRIVRKAATTLMQRRARPPRSSSRPPSRRTKGMTMTRERTKAPRCASCGHVLPTRGAICHACDVEAHFEGAIRTAPPIVTPPREPAPRPRSGRRAS